MGSQKDYFKGFSRLDYTQRLTHLYDGNFVTEGELLYLKQTADKEMLAVLNKLIENVIGSFQLPLGIAPHFRIDNKDYLIPMAIEETSIIAAASGTAKWLREHGEIETQTIGCYTIGQIQLPKVRDVGNVMSAIEQNKQMLMDIANEKVVANLVSRGGGVKDIVVRVLPRDDGTSMVILHILMDTCDAMGANMTNQVCEFLKPPIQDITNHAVGICILSNLTDTKITRATVKLRNVEQQLCEAIVEAGYFAKLDPYRAATHNKGILNGIDGVIIATGNDWRAVEAGMHAYAARNGQYSPLTEWHYDGHTLVGILEAPITLGIVGGVTRSHPTAQLCLRLLGIENADHLARIVAAVGLVQNLGALRALTTDGIIKGHMKLHLNNLLLAVGASKEEEALLKKSMETFLEKHHKITLSDVKKLQASLRNHVR